MKEKKKEEKLKPEAGDIAHAVTKGLMSAVPVLGGPVAELFSLLLVPSLQRRRDEWLRSIAEGLRELQEKVEGFKIEELQNNEMFVTTVMHALQAAIRNHQEEKLEALRNAVLNAALPNPPEEDLQLMFLSHVDALTPSHLRVLKFLDDPVGWAQSHSPISPSRGTIFDVLSLTFADFGWQRELYEQLITDLHARGLLTDNVEHLRVDSPLGKLLRRYTTKLGKEFLRFITSPIEKAHHLSSSAAGERGEKKREQSVSSAVST